MKKWVWNGWETMAPNYETAKRNITYKAFGRRPSVYRNLVDPKEVK